MLGLKCEYILHVHTHVRMTEQHTLGLKIVFLSIWFRVWYNYPLLLMCYSNSVRCGCSEVTASCRLWESLDSFKRDCISVSAVHVEKKHLQSLRWALSLGMTCQEDSSVFPSA